MTTNTPIDDSPHELNNGAWVPRGAIVDISPDVLTDADGRWTVVHGIQRWVPNPPAPPGEEEPPTVVCPTCNATATGQCRTTGGKARSDHAARLAPRCCPCGGPVGPWQKWCDDCRPIVSRRIWRDSQKRRRAS